MWQYVFKHIFKIYLCRCSTCGLRHPRKITDRPHYAARECASCKIRHSAREVRLSFLQQNIKYILLIIRFHARATFGLKQVCWVYAGSIWL